MKKILLLGVFIFFTIFSLFIGVINIDFSSIFISGSTANSVILLSRLPRTISIILSGFSISICGLIMQHLTMNKFVSPTTAGTADSAKFGVLIALLFFPGATLITKSITALIFALIGTFLFIKITTKIKFKDSVLIPLIGLIFGSIVNSITTFFAYTSDLIQNVNNFLLGDFSSIVNGSYELLYLSIPFIILAFIYAKKFTIAGVGEDFATNLGLKYKHVVRIGFLIVCIVSSLNIVTIGAIPFLGLIVPNMVTIFGGDNISKNIFITGIFGSIFLLVCDIISRVVIFPYEIPISMTVGIIGSLIFLSMIVWRDKLEKH